MAIKINKEYPAKTISYSGSRTADKIKYIVVHYTGNKSDKAVNNAKYYQNTNTRAAGAHYFVDKESIYQSVDDLKVANAVGGTKYSDCATSGGGSMYGLIKNNNSISIELCSENGAIASATITNAVDLIKWLMEKYNIPAANVYRHFDVNGKPCPGWNGWIKSDVSKWSAFKSKLGTASAAKVTYYTKYTGTSTSIVIALGSCGEKNTSLANRKKIATENGIKGYTGAAAQNSQMLTLLKSGKLKKA